MRQTSRRRFLSVGGGVVTGVTLSGIGTATATEEVTFRRTFVDYQGEAVADARVNVGYSDGEAGEYLGYLTTDEDGTIQFTVPGGSRVRMGFYKSSEDEFLAPRLDGVPHIHTLDPVTVADEGTDSGEYDLPEAQTLDVRAYLGGPGNGVEDAIPRFGSVRDESYYASGYSYTTTNEDGYMKLKAADFTGVEMTGDTRIWLYPPTYEPYEDQDKDDYGPYAKVTKRDVDVTEDTTIEMNMSRGNGKGNGNRKGNGNDN